jgi:hypothetical protein
MADNHTIIPRKDAIARGLKRYFTGKPCKHGHVRERFINTRVCVECNRVFQVKWYLENSDTKLAKNKQYLKDHPEVGRKAALRWRNKNIERARESANRWYADNPEKRRALALKKIKAKPEVYRAIWHKRRARKVAAGGSYDADDLAAILEAQNFCCSYCSADLRKVKKHIDHIMPLARGGSNDKSNLQYTCNSCNCKKRDKDPIAFAREIGRLL